ncbi:MAG TPA: tetratricopeptide repeat protein, partial [Gemmatimonadaceae bacterium]|nr:tetratricopeptide repeat protein [Gemmatimonadaceae bacterium]
SPEQAAGERTLDARTDVYALGAVLYEMLAGEPPFTGPSAQAVIAKRLAHPPPRLQVVRSAVPDALETVLQRALATVPADRYPNARAFADALGRPDLRPTALRLPDWLTSGRRFLTRRVAYVGGLMLVLTAGYTTLIRGTGDAREFDRERIVVLPFQHVGPPDEEYFADGLTEEVTSRLSGIEQLGVIARTSATQYKSSPKPMSQIGEELGVSYAVEGSVRWASPALIASEQRRLRISARLIRVATGTHVWSDEFDVTLANIFAVQSSIAEQVARALDIVLLEPQRRRLAARPTENVDAYDFYLRGNGYYNRSWSRLDVEMALEMYERAAMLDPGFALAWAHIGRTHAWIHRLGYDPSEARLAAAKAAADSALALDPSLPESHIALGSYYYWGRADYDRASSAFLTARNLRPGNAAVFQQIGNVQRRQGRWTDAIASYRQASELDPRSHIIWFNLADTYFQMRQYELAGGPLDRSLTLAPDFLDGYIAKASLALAWRGDTARARRVMEDAEARIAPTQWRPLYGYWLFGLSRSLYGDPSESLRRIAPGTYGLDTVTYFLAKAEALTRAGRPDLAGALADSATRALRAEEPLRARQPLYHGQLALALAMLGRSTEAIAAAERAIDLLSVSRDALDGPDWMVNLARVYAMVGRHDDAVRQLAAVLDIPARVSAASVRLDPAWRPLHGHPEFRRLVGVDPSTVDARVQP